MTERERFEAWVVDTGLPDAMQADWLWECWQAAISGDVAAEPVAWLWLKDGEGEPCAASLVKSTRHANKPLYAAPPAKPQDWNAAIDAVLTGLRSEDDSTQPRAIIASVEALRHAPAKPHGERVLLYRAPTTKEWRSMAPNQDTEAAFRNAGFTVRYATLDSEEA